jgi:hypothetical protein
MPKFEWWQVQPGTGFIYFKLTDRELGFSLLDTAGFSTASAGFGGIRDLDFSVLARTANIRAILGKPTAKFIGESAGGAFHTPAAVLPPPSVIVLASSSTVRSLVGHPIMIYKIPQIVQLTYPAIQEFKGYFMDNYPVNRTDFRLVRGIQNEINFYVRDVDRKPVVLGNTEILAINIFDQATDSLLMSRNFTTIDATKGIYLLTVLPDEINDWPTAAMTWSVSYTRADGSTVILWTDRNYSPYSTLTVTKAPVPPPIGSTVVSTFDTLLDGNQYSPALRGSALNGFSGGTQTFNFFMTSFTGSIRLDASTLPAPINDEVSSDWFQVDLQNFSANTGNIVLNESGDFKWMRAVITQTLGAVDQMQYRS